ncbi:MAG: hypothetical protein ACI9S8_000847 [Chlamydiales bacterium]
MGAVYSDQSAFLFYKKGVITMTITYCDAGVLYPDLLKQVFGGESEHNYKLNSGSIIITYIKKDEGLERKMLSSGSLEVAVTATRVANFFREFPFSEYYNLENPRLKDCLEHAFHLIIGGKREITLLLSDGFQVTVSLEHRRLDLNRITRESLPQEDLQLVNEVEYFIQIPCLKDFTSNRGYYPENPRIY